MEKSDDELAEEQSRRDEAEELEARFLKVLEEEGDDETAAHEWRLHQAQQLLDAYHRGELPEDVRQEIEGIINKDE